MSYESIKMLCTHKIEEYIRLIPYIGCIKIISLIHITFMIQSNLILGSLFRLLTLLIT